jgi:hypothetical protein
MTAQNRPQHYRIRRMVQMVRESAETGYLANSGNIQITKDLVIPAIGGTGRLCKRLQTSSQICENNFLIWYIFRFVLTYILIYGVLTSGMKNAR